MCYAGRKLFDMINADGSFLIGGKKNYNDLQLQWLNYNDLTVLPRLNHGLCSGNHPLLWPQDSG